MPLSHCPRKEFTFEDYWTDLAVCLGSILFWKNLCYSFLCMTLRYELKCSRTISCPCKHKHEQTDRLPQSTSIHAGSAYFHWILLLSVHCPVELFIITASSYVSCFSSFKLKRRLVGLKHPQLIKHSTMKIFSSPRKAFFNIDCS